jgi:hypothetical protein
MLPSKDVNFVGYTFKSSDVFNPMHPTGVGKTSGSSIKLKIDGFKA